MVSQIVERIYRPRSIENGHNDLTYALDRGHAQSNALRFNQMRSGTAFGEKLFRAFNDPILADHGHPHARIVEKSIYRLVDAIDVSLLGSATDSAVIDALLLTPYFHDLDLQLSAIHNLQPENKDSQLNIKKAHGLGAAAILLAMTQRYLDAANQGRQARGEQLMTYGDARQRTGMAAVMMMKHEDPERYQRLFIEERTPAYVETDLGTRTPLHGEELYDLFESNELDFMTLTPAQILELTREFKGRAGFLKDGTRTYGLSPAFEAEFASELETISQDDERIIPDDELLRGRLRKATEIFYRADLSHMVSPYFEAITRTFLGQYSRQRPLWKGHAIEEAISIATGNDGRLCPDDWTRLAWEFIQIGTLTDETELSQSSYVRQFNKDHAMLGIVTLQRIYTFMMNGGKDIQTAIDLLYLPRFVNLEYKRRFSEEMVQAGNPADTQAAMERLEANYMSQLKKIYDEKNEVVAAIKGKRPQAEYSQRQKVDVREFLDVIRQELIEMHNVTPEELAQYQEMVRVGQIPDTQPTKYGDSIQMDMFKTT